MDLTCQELVELVTEYLEDAMSSHDRDRFEAHLETCAGCDAHLLQVRETVRILRSLAPESLPEHTERDLLAALRGWNRGG